VTAALQRSQPTDAPPARGTTAHAHDRYALALMELALDAGQLSAVESDIQALGEAIASSADLQRALRHPLIARAQHDAVLQAIAAKTSMQSLTKKFISLVVAKKRQGLLPDIAAAFAALCAAQRGELTATVTSAHPLSSAQQDELVRILSVRHHASVKLNVAVDPSLLGGMRIHIGATLYDRTIASQLNRLTTQLQEAA
jgi:F-type H+-transporting ATPase subunit delta